MVVTLHNILTKATTS